jgi:hypothetical protein
MKGNENMKTETEKNENAKLAKDTLAHITAESTSYDERVRDTFEIATLRAVLGSLIESGDITEAGVRYLKYRLEH